MTGFDSKKAAALDEDGMYLVHQTAHDLATYGTSWTQDGKRIDPMSVYAQPAQEPDVVMHCDSHTWTINNPPPKGSGDVNLYYAPAKEKNT